MLLEIVCIYYTFGYELLQLSLSIRQALCFDYSSESMSIFCLFVQETETKKCSQFLPFKEFDPKN